MAPAAQPPVRQRKSLTVWNRRQVTGRDGNTATEELPAVRNLVNYGIKTVWNRVAEQHVNVLFPDIRELINTNKTEREGRRK